ncbi:MAG TPA: ABC transporter ATP-binding protein [Symbiobacteriaceae bacterium]|nr:ABC transporter ATP-binding protein [Symbiobacteriaceae bacterium]
MPIVQTVDLAKTYGSGPAAVVALRPTSMSIDEGEFVAVVGPSGSGKSTLLHLLGGLDRPTAGRVLLDGREMYALSETELSIFRRRKIGFVFQFYNLIPVLSAEENIVLPLLLDGRPVDQAYIDELLAFLGLTDRRHHLPGALSGGQQQRAAIARALATKPALILADEPTGNLDSRSSQEVIDLLCLSARRYHQTLVMITHNLQLAAHADRVITIADGAVASDRVVRA